MNNSIPPTISVGRSLLEEVATHPADNIEAVLKWERFPGGASTNIACALAQFGNPTSLVACVGKDPAGSFVKESIQNYGVDARDLALTDQAPTFWARTFYKHDGTRVLVTPDSKERFADSVLSESDIPRHLFETPGFLVLQTAQLSRSGTRSAVYRAKDLAKEYGFTILLDVNYRKSSWTDEKVAREEIKALLAHVDIFKCTSAEAQWLIGSDSPTELRRAFPASFGAIVTHDEKGSEYSFNQLSGFVPGFQVQEVDVTGAGDAFVSGLVQRISVYGLSALSNKAACEEILSFANAAGAICVTKRGAINSLPTIDQVMEFMERTPRSG